MPSIVEMYRDAERRIVVLEEALLEAERFVLRVGQSFTRNGDVRLANDADAMRRKLYGARALDTQEPRSSGDSEKP